MLKVCSVICHVLAGFLFYMVCLMAFMSMFPGGAKALMLGGFLLAALIVMAVGLAFTGFRRWKRDAGLVLIWTSATNAFLVLTMSCMLARDDFRKLMPADIFEMFGSYFAGVITMALLAVAGWLLYKADDQPATALQP